MILYDYRCYRCKEEFTLRRRMDCRNQPATCPECGAAGKRMFSVPQPHMGVWQRETNAETIRTTPEIWE